MELEVDTGHEGPKIPNGLVHSTLWKVLVFMAVDLLASQRVQYRDGPSRRPTEAVARGSPPLSPHLTPLGVAEAGTSLGKGGAALFDALPWAPGDFRLALVQCYENGYSLATIIILWRSLPLWVHYSSVPCSVRGTSRMESSNCFEVDLCGFWRAVLKKKQAAQCGSPQLKPA